MMLEIMVLVLLELLGHSETISVVLQGLRVAMVQMAI